MSGNYNQRQINKLMPLVSQANHRYQEYSFLKEEDFPKKTEEFKDRIAKWETLDDILPEAFGLVKQACKKLIGKEIEVRWQKQIWDMVPYDVQLLWWIILHKWIITEMKTWEGKTLVAVAPVYLNALEWKGVHVVTVNDYLASRDSDWMSAVYNFLWLSVGCVTKKVSLQQRREMYEKDITYIENSELWFDFLRDNLVKTIKERVLTWRPLNYAIVDEIDSILIDEARTPLIISEARAEATDKYAYYSQIVRLLNPCSTKKKVSKGLLNELIRAEELKQEEDWDYYIDEKTKSVSLSGMWINKLEWILKVENLYKDIGYEEIHHIENALRAQAVYQRDREYIVVNWEVLIVDEHTGRTMPGRRFSEWLHQAIEAKEGVAIQKESKTMATITYQNFFKQYKKLGGMTGTATTEGEEFEKIYELWVLEIPTNRPTIRVDRSDKVYFNQAAKRKFVKDYIKFAYEIGQPILIGTSSIDTSEHVSKVLEKEGITHYVLNAKFHEQEAHIVSQAGKFKSVVVATNMAWRGTDIKLDKWLNDKLADNYASWTKKQTLAKTPSSVSALVYSQIEYELTMDGFMRVWNLNEEQIRTMESGGLELDNVVLKVVFNSRKKNNEDAYAKIVVDHKNSSDLIQKDFHYWLFILGTEKHESRRIDNQLRGRAGRQWDPGVSVFFVALDDLIMRKMWWERIQSMAAMLLPKGELENLELTQKQFNSSIVRAQKQMEAWHFSSRKHVFEYDSVINKQRQAIYKKRDDILFAEQDEARRKTLVESMLAEIPQNIRDVVGYQITTAQTMGQSESSFLETASKEFGLEKEIISQFAGQDFAQLMSSITEHLVNKITTALSSADEMMSYMLLRDVYLYHLDNLWVKHIDEMEYLRDKVGLMWYAQIDPLVVYKKEAFEKFQTLLLRLKQDVTTYLMNFDFGGKPSVEPVIEAQTDPNYLDILQKAWSSAKNIKIQVPKWQSSKNDGGVEVFEVSSQPESPYKNIFDWDTKKAKPNDPCPCGSWKKYKKCCWAV